MSQLDKWYQFHATTRGYIGTTLCQIPTLYGPVGEKMMNDPIDVELVQKLLNQAMAKGYIRQFGTPVPETGSINGRDYTIMLIRQFQINQGLRAPNSTVDVTIFPGDETLKRLIKIMYDYPYDGRPTGKAFLFVIADEILPSRKLVRKVIMVDDYVTNSHIINYPEEFGFSPRNPSGRKTLGDTSFKGAYDSQYSPASTKPGGAPNLQGKRFYIDIKKAEAAGVKIHSTEAIIADLRRMLSEQPHLEPQLSKLIWAVKNVEGEVMLEGHVPATAVKTPVMMEVTRVFQFLQFVGVVFTAYDLSDASVKSVKRGSIRPIAAETVRQVGGWGGALLGAKIGGSVGVLVGIETGPGALITGGIGTLIFGTAGYFGADWIADYIDKN